MMILMNDEKDDDNNKKHNYSNLNYEMKAIIIKLKYIFTILAYFISHI